MKKEIILLFLFTSSILFSQSSWINYANDHIIYDMEFENNQLWVATQGGVVKIDTQTGDKEIFQAWNSGLRGTGLREVEIAADGTKWFGSERAGLFKYDGTNWEQFYYLNSGDTLIQVIDLKLDPDGNPWFFSNINGNCTGCKQLISYDGTLFKNHTPQIYPTVGYTVDFEFINSDELLIADTKKIVKYNGNEITETFDETNSPLTFDDFITQIEIDDQGNLWVATNHNIVGGIANQIFKYDGTNWTTENTGTLGSVTSFFQDINGKLWFEYSNSATNGKNYGAYDGSNWSYWLGADLPTIANLGFSSRFKSVDAQGNWWMVIYNGILEPKIHKIDGNSVTSYDTQISPVISSYFDNIVADCDNNVWIMGSGGLSKLDGQNWENYPDSLTGFSGALWEGTLDTASCDLWFALYSSGSADTDIGKYNGTDFETFSVGIGSALSVDFGLDGTLYAGTTQGGLGRYISGVWNFSHENNSPLSNFIRAVDVQSDGTVWVATYGNGLGSGMGTSWTMFDPSNSPIDDHVYNVYVDNDDNVWVESGIGLAKYDGTDWEIFSFDLEYGVSCIAQDHLGNYWIGTGEGALYWNGFDYVKFDVTNSNIGGNFIRNIHIDPVNGDIWFINSIGVSVLKDFHADESISGVAFFDTNQNGLFDSNEDVRLPDQQILLLPDSTIAITNSLGAYSLYPDDIGNYEITYEPAAPYLPTSPTTIDSFFNGESIIDINFAVWTEDIPAGASIDIVTGPMVCNNEMNVWVTFRNEGFTDISGEINLSFDTVFAYSNSYPTVSSFETDQVTWTFDDLSFMHSRTYKLTLIAPGVDVLNQEFEFSAAIVTSNQSEPITLIDELLCSYDPNDKTAIPIGESISNFSLLDDPIQYIIRFQNMGNYLAEDIVVTDIIDPSLDISTFKILSSSHEMTTTIGSDRKVVFRFEDINLPPEEENYLGSQGYIKYQIAPLPELSDSTTIQNTAEIYFDLNPPIVTNTTENILVESLYVSSENLEHENQILIYPNPSNKEIWIEWQGVDTDSEWQIEVFDLSGKLLYRKQSKTSKDQISIPEKGFYILKIQKGEYLQVERIVVLGL
ncbi:MAG: T9SS type A sorting domain-containing protein [Saprospiraceae bacterium]